MDARGITTGEPGGERDADRAETTRDHERLIGVQVIRVVRSRVSRANERRRVRERVRIAEKRIRGVLSRRNDRDRPRRRRRASRERRGEPRHGRRGGVGDVAEIHVDEIDIRAIFASRATFVVEEKRRAPRASKPGKTRASVVFVRDHLAEHRARRFRTPPRSRRCLDEGAPLANRGERGGDVVFVVKRAQNHGRFSFVFGVSVVFVSSRAFDPRRADIVESRRHRRRDRASSSFVRERDDDRSVIVRDSTRDRDAKVRLGANVRLGNRRRAFEGHPRRFERAQRRVDESKRVDVSALEIVLAA